MGDVKGEDNDLQSKGKGELNDQCTITYRVMRGDTGSGHEGINLRGTGQHHSGPQPE